MLGIRRKMVIALSTVVVLGAAASPSLAALTVRNTSTYTGAGRWDWTIFLDADPDTLRQVECVEYVLHPTFPNPVRKVCKKPETKFAYSTNGWGTFTVKVKILNKDRSVEVLNHLLVFQQPAPKSRDVIARNWSREIEPGWWEWRIFVEGTPAQLDQIRCVEYTLHRTFPNRVRVVCSRPDRFELKARGWGEFEVGIKLMLKDGSIGQLSHQLEFR